MRRILVLGGTGWLGREIARRAHESGAEVVCLARGESGPAPDGVRLVRADRSLAGAYEGLGGEWDDVVELASEPQLVESALKALAARAAHWTLVSTVSVYADNSTPGADETAQLVDPQNLAEYPDAKVAAERASAAELGDRLLIARPGLIAGPGDPSDRLGYWPARLHRGGNVLAPMMSQRFVQFIDVEDLADWIVSAGAAGIAGVVNAVGEVHTMEDFFRAHGRSPGSTANSSRLTTKSSSLSTCIIGPAPGLSRYGCRSRPRALPSEREAPSLPQEVGRDRSLTP
ncbi:NAD-dependent epimerase/dehydratase family protein [Microbacterium sp. Ru50]|uniref:NAD-dependent epimerase/dehydratase family protein n=1 Tax=Microbacterium sp. Ru50 TaxID=2080744 RepID=UPI0027E4F517|nr:NAD-dependent epimerase/dehydratase family protein [Microbacterium sp. Ru50]